MSNLKKNLKLQTIYQVLITITPLITSPYVSRILHPEGLGIYSYTNANVNYFLMIAMLGTSNYGSRSIAMAKNEAEQKKLFSEIYLFQIIMSFFAIICYLIYCFSIKSNRTESLLQTILLLSCMLDVSWYFFGREEFSITVSISIVTKLIYILLLFLLVRKSTDVYAYIIVMGLGVFLTNAFLWAIVIKKKVFCFPPLKDIYRHIRPNLILFVPVLAMSAYRTMDKTMLGALASDYAQVGYYYNSDKLLNIPFGIITGFGTVMLPKASSIRAIGRDEDNKKLLEISLDAFMCLAIAMTFGISAISYEFVPFFFGKDYEACIELTMGLSVVLMIKTVSNTLRTQYLIPYNKEKIFTVSVFSGVAVNFIANLIFIKLLKLDSLGAVIGTVTAEFAVCTVQILLTEKDIHSGKMLLSNLWYVLFGLIMFFLIRLTAALINFDIVPKLVCEILSGGLIYGAACIVYWKVTGKPFLSLLKSH